ncbi:MAG: asparagine synthase (glutamine-hydrolyzing) [Burkholderiaceae bacterium]
MCGIAGLFSAERAVSDGVARDALLRRMTGVIAHRGPDDEGIWHDALGRCSLGHRRLSIIDTSPAGHQPMIDASGRWVISYNGEIYNFEELRAQLKACGISFRGRTDTEVLLHALALWGVDALPRLDGMFALAAFDRASGQLILARDAFGEKPLYYAELAGGGLAFASELHALETVPGVGGHISLDSVAELLMFQYIGAPRTVYSGVSKLQPGHWLTAYPGQAPKIGRYFAFQPGSSGFDHRPLDQLADELEDILVRSLRRRLISDVPLGAFLSGGVDSSTVCALIRRQLKVPLKTFSIGFQGAADSEHEVARVFAAHLGTEHHDKIIAPNASEFLLNIGRVLDEPNADSSCLPTYLLSAFARQTVTVALSGDGGDELFAGYDRYFATLDESTRHRAPDWSPGRDYYSNRILVSVEEHIKELFGFVPARAAGHLERLRAEVDRTNVPLVCRLRQTDVENYMPGAVLPKVDRMSMQHSLEVRTPFLNIELARFAERLPQETLYNGARGKLLLREVAYRYLPRALVDLPKKGFGLPMSRWGQNELLQVASTLLESDESRIRAALGRDAIARFMQRQRSDGGCVTYQVWALTMLESWLRHHPGRMECVETERGSAIAVNDRADESSIQAWKIADGVLAVTDAASAGDGSSSLPASASELMPLIAAHRDVWESVVRSGECRPLLQTQTSWSAFIQGEGGAGGRSALGGATLLLATRSAAALTGWSSLDRLRRMGVARVVLRHPYGGDGSVVTISLHRPTLWRRGMNLLGLLRFGFGRVMFARAVPEQGNLWIAAPLGGLAAGEVELSDRYALFEGLRQLPPVPASNADIRRWGDGRYSVKGGAVRFASTKAGARSPKSFWMVERNARTEHRLPFVSNVVTPVGFERRRPFMLELKAAIADAAKLPDPASLQRGDSVVVLTHALPPGGAERQWCYLAGELKRMGHNVDFVTLFPLAGDDKHYLPLLTGDGVRLTELTQREISEREMLAAAHAKLERAILGDAEAGMDNPFGQQLRDLVELFMRLKPRVVYAQLDSCNLIAATAGLLASVPQIVLSFRNYNPSRFSYLSNDWFQPLYALLAKSPSVLMTGNSRAANADYARWIGVDDSRIRLIPNAIDTAALTAPAALSLSELRQQLGVMPDSPVILGVFRLSEEKRPLLFVETFAAIHARLPQARALVAGVGPFEPAMRQRIDELKLQSSLTLLGRRDDVPQLMQISFVLLLTSSFEGMPNVVMEAQALGIPVVAPNLGGVPDCMIDGQTGYVVDRDDIGGFARRCIELLEHDDVRKRFGINGAAYMRNSFSRQAMARRYLEVLNDGAEVDQELPEPIRATAA